MRALERDGLLRTLAEPNLTAVSGEPAKFLAGGEYPVPVVDSLGQVSVTYKEYGIGLAFTPVVMSEGRISLKIESEVSELTNDGAVVLSGISIPALKKRQANSTVELPSGGSLALAGLLSEDTPPEHRRVSRPQGSADPRHAVSAAATSRSRRPSSS